MLRVLYSVFCLVAGSAITLYLVFCLLAGVAIANISDAELKQLDDLAVKNFVEYLRIPSVQPNVNYTDCIAFITRQAESLGLPIRVYEVHKDKPVAIITWEGTDPKAPSILLNSHMDVVSTPNLKKWKHPPFEAHMEENGDIYARGAQDMKNFAIAYLEAIRRFRLSGERLKRTLHVSFLPDEELGGVLGMKLFVKTKHFRDLNLGFALDEGVPSASKKQFRISLGEKTTWHLWVHCRGASGHTSLALNHTAGEKAAFMLNKFTELKAQEKAKLSDPNMTYDDVTAVNLVGFQGGVGDNVIPSELSMNFDIRLDPSKDLDQFSNMLDSWCKEAGKGVSIQYRQKDPKVKITSLDNNPYWDAFKRACDKLNVSVDIELLSGSSDIRYVRQLGIPALGFAPFNFPEIRAHSINEFINKDVFLNGIKVYMTILREVANI